jgi:RHS repeat-associated protein
MAGPQGERLIEVNGSFNLLHYNAFWEGKLLGTFSGSAAVQTNWHFSLNDWLGTKRVTTTSTGTPWTSVFSGPFGDFQSQTGPGSDPSEEHFTSKPRDPNSNLDYFGARYYNSNLGRFLSPDFNGTDDYASPIPYADLGNPQTLNLYGYAGNNPLSNVDPDGHDVYVCVDNGNGGQNCFNATDDQWKAIQHRSPGVQFNLDNFGSGSISCGGSTCGSAQYFEPGLQDESGGMLMGIAGGIAADFAIGKVAGAVSSMLGRGAAEAAGAGAGKAAGAAVDVTNLSAKIVKQMGTRGWTAQEITETVENGTAHAVTNKATGGAATEYINPANGKFVVVDNSTKQVLQVSGPGFSPNHLVNP